MPIEIPPTAPSIDLSDLEIGELLIDEQHRRLFSLFDKLRKSAASHSDTDQFNDLLSQLGQLIFTHFHDEEILIRSLSMPESDTAPHFRAHQTIIERYATLSLELMEGKAITQQEMLSMVQDWVLKHLYAHDLKLRPFLAQRKQVHAPSG